MLRFVHSPLMRSLGARTFTTLSRPLGSLSPEKLAEIKPVAWAHVNPPLTHPDQMTRYPEASARGVLRFMDYFGTSVFAVGGCLIAGHAGMDLLGCTAVGCITAMGGGTWRDILLGKGSVFWLEEQEYLWIAMASAVGTFFLWRHQDVVEEDSPVMFWTDAVSLGAFGVIGAMNSIRMGFGIPMGLFMALITCTGGGVTRDVLTKRPVRIMHNHAEIYAFTASAASLTYLLLRRAAVAVPPAIFAGVAAGTLARYAATIFDAKLPTMSFEKQPDAVAVGVQSTTTEAGRAAA